MRRTRGIIRISRSLMSGILGPKDSILMVIIADIEVLEWNGSLWKHDEAGVAQLPTNKRINFVPLLRFHFFS